MWNTIAHSCHKFNGGFTKVGVIISTLYGSVLITHVMKYKDSCYYIAGPLTRKDFDTQFSSIAYHI